jgi:hypothetical protein
VTGASGGIGGAVAVRLARDGFGVVLSYAGNAAKAEEAAAKIEAAGGHAIAVQANVASAADVERLFQEALSAFGRIDVVVNGAGIMPMGPITDGSLEAFDRISRLRPLHRGEGRRGGLGSGARQRVPRPRHHRQRPGARPGVDRALPEGQDGRPDRAVSQARPARAAGPA